MAQRLNFGLVLLFLTFAAAASAQESAPPVAPSAAPASPLSNGTDGDDIIAVARLQDTGLPSIGSERLERLDDIVWSEIESRKQTRYELFRLAQRDTPCNRECAMEEARRAGARYLVWAAVRDPRADAVVVAFVISMDGGDVFLTKTSGSTDLDLGVSAVAVQVSNALFPSKADGRGPKTGTAAVDMASTGDTMSRASQVDAERDRRERNSTSTAYIAKKHRRNAGIGTFVAGTILAGTGGALWGAGASMGSDAGGMMLVIAGVVLGGVGTITFFSGLGLWISNQVKMNKIERGIPLSRRLKLEGLSPVVASREGAAPGLSAAFSF